MLTLSLNELLAYTDEERAKWHRWLRDNPSALELQLQPGGRFATVGSLIDHMFLVEARHLARLQGATVPESSGIATPDVEALFRYGAAVRLALRNFASSLSDEDAAKVREFVGAVGYGENEPTQAPFPYRPARDQALGTNRAWHSPGGCRASRESRPVLLVRTALIVVVGAGAAGLMAAIFAASSSHRVVLLERTADGGRKILISGGGRCNVLPSVLAPERFVTDSPAHLMRGMLRSWSLVQQRAYLRERPPPITRART